MSALAFLLLALAIMVIGSLVLWLRARGPRSVGASVDEFAREMRALAPPGRSGDGGDGSDRRDDGGG